MPIIESTFVIGLKKYSVCRRVCVHFLYPEILQAGGSEGVIETTQTMVIVQELCESRGGRPELSVLTSLLVSVDVKNY